jgi:hypothetical protein
VEKRILALTAENISRPSLETLGLAKRNSIVHTGGADIMASEAEERSQLLLLERPRPAAVQNRRTKPLATAAGRATRLALMCHWHPAGQDRLECRWTIESITGTGALRGVGDNDQTTADARTDSVRTPGLAPQERPGGNGRVVEFPLAHEVEAPQHDRKIEDELYRRLRRQDALVFAIGLLFLAVGTAATYLYWDYARPFVATDDPFLAARQFPVVARPIPVSSRHEQTRNDTPGAPTSKTIGLHSERSEAPRPTPDPAELLKYLADKIAALRRPKGAAAHRGQQCRQFARPCG